ncbi:hypothetical protein MASR1M12_37520 [Erysipelotrichia bacterium]
MAADWPELQAAATVFDDTTDLCGEITGLKGLPKNVQNHRRTGARCQARLRQARASGTFICAR